MKSIVFSDEKKAFHYLYSFQRREMLYIEPIMYDICTLFLENNIVLLTNVIAILKQKYDITRIYESYNEFIYFKKNGFLEQVQDFNIATTYAPADIEAAEVNVRVLSFELTQRCNLQCFYCVYGSLYSNTENNHNRDLTFEQAKALLDYFINRVKKGTSVRKVLTIGFYGGEPLLKFTLMKQIVEYTKLFECSEIHFEYTITTNGLLLDKYIDFLVNNNFITLISLDGNKYSSSYRTTAYGENPFSLISKNVKELQHRYPDYYKYRVVFNSVLHNRNSALSTLKYIKNNFGKIPLFSTLSSISINKKNMDVFNSTYKSLSEDMKKYKNDFSKEDFMAISPNINFLDKFFANLLGTQIMDLRFLLCEQRNIVYIPTATCSPFSFKVFLSADGKIHPCEKVGYKYPLGHIDEQNKLILNKQNIANLYNSFFEPIKEECARCYNIYTCSTCLFETNAKCNYVSRDTFKKRMSQYVTELQEKQDMIRLK